MLLSAISPDVISTSCGRICWWLRNCLRRRRKVLPITDELIRHACRSACGGMYQGPYWIIFGAIFEYNNTVPFRTICPSRVTSQVVLDEIGCCPASHEEVVGFEKPLAKWSKKTLFFRALRVPTCCKCSFGDNGRYSSYSTSSERNFFIGALITHPKGLCAVKPICLFESLPTPQFLINLNNLGFQGHHVFKLLSESARDGKWRRKWYIGGSSTST